MQLTANKTVASFNAERENLPRRIQLSRRKGFRLPANTVNVARPSRWGNPFRVRIHGDRGECVDLYEQCLAEFPVSKSSMALWRAADGDPAMLVALAARVRPVLQELRGKNLACWCKPGEKCHADVLLRIVKELERPMTVRCKFQCTEVANLAWGGQRVVFEPRYDDSIPEDQRFCKATPSGRFELQLGTDDKDKYQLGTYYYFDATPIAA